MAIKTLSGRLMTLAMLITLTSCFMTNVATQSEQLSIDVPNGIKVEDVTATSVVLSAKADREAIMELKLPFDHSRTLDYSTSIMSAADFTGKIYINDLEPNKTYEYSVIFIPKDIHSFEPGETPHSQTIRLTGRFKTAPSLAHATPVKFSLDGN